MENLKEKYRKLLLDTQTDFVRYMFDKINWNNRLLGLVGARGVGKTTLVLQHIKQQLNPDETLYVVADDLYFSNHRNFYAGRRFCGAIATNCAKYARN